MGSYKPTIGLEVHAELNTRSKMFCGCPNDPDEVRPNTAICPVCMAHPGALPVINKEAVHKVLRVGAALGGQCADHSVFDRKNYFYPDIPKGFQISQYLDPLVLGGVLAGVAITRVHLEEDTARSSHEGDRSLIDFNRAGVPLMELVTDPCIGSAEEAGLFAQELQLLLRYLGVSEANMEKGEMRVEANVSVSTDATLGTKVEVKNLNSFRSVERAVDYEIKRQSALLEHGTPIEQETRGWDEEKQSTFSQRKKESSHDYRYFPEPDLPRLQLSDIEEFLPESLREDLPELPSQRRKRYLDLGLREDDVEVFVYDERSAPSMLFEAVVKSVPGDTRLMQLAANYILSDVRSYLADPRILGSTSSITASNFIELMRMVTSESISSRGAKDILASMYTTGGDPQTIAKEKGLLQQSDTVFLEEVAQKIIAQHSEVAEEYRAGKSTTLQFLVGQGMKETHGSANPAALRAIFERLLR